MPSQEPSVSLNLAESPNLMGLTWLARTACLHIVHSGMLLCADISLNPNLQTGAAGL